MSMSTATKNVALAMALVAATCGAVSASAANAFDNPFKKVAQSFSGAADELRRQAQIAAQNAADEAQRAAEEVRRQAQIAAQKAADEAQRAAEEVRRQAQIAAQKAAEEAQRAAEEVRRQAQIGAKKAANEAEKLAAPKDLKTMSDRLVKNAKDFGSHLTKAAKNAPKTSLSIGGKAEEGLEYVETKWKQTWKWVKGYWETVHETTLEFAEPTVYGHLRTRINLKLILTNLGESPITIDVVDASARDKVKRVSLQGGEVFDGCYYSCPELHIDCSSGEASRLHVKAQRRRGPLNDFMIFIAGGYRDPDTLGRKQSPSSDPRGVVPPETDDIVEEVQQNESEGYYFYVHSISGDLASWFGPYETLEAAEWHYSASRWWTEDRGEPWHSTISPQWYDRTPEQ